MDKLLEYFEAGAAHYQAQSLRWPWSWLRAREAAAVMGLLQPQPDEAILDAGSGAGFYSELLLKAGAEVTALDISPAMLDQLRGRLGIKTIESDLATAELEPRYDAVLCAGALEFLTQDKAGEALRRFAQALRPKGSTPRIVLLLPQNSPAGKIYQRFHRRHGIDVSLYDAAWIKAVAAESGCTVLEMKRVTLNWAILLQLTEPAK